MSLSPGTKLGRYEIKSKIGEGGMGEVYRARDEKLNRDVAIKVLPITLSENSDRLHRFEQEAQAAGALNHPNILAVYDVGMHESAPYVVSELLEGESFRDLLNDGPIASRKAINYAAQIARGLAAAHEKGIVHRDLKPDNLFLTKDDRVKILDFGLAKLTQPTREQSEQSDIATRRVHTDPGTVMGTAGYMSPEQVKAGPIDHRSDIFSFGTVLYEMLAGRRAFRKDSAVETLNAILKEEPPELTNSNPAIAPALERVVWHCLEKSPERRFQSATDVAFALESLTGATSHSSQQTVAGLPALSTTKHWTRERLIWLSAALLLLAGLSVFAYLYLSRSETNHRSIRLAFAIPNNATLPANITVSPDGTRVVFIATNTEGKRLLWLRSLDSVTTQPLAGTEGAVSPFWSPDSHFIAYFANRKLFKVEASGGRPQALCDATEDRGGSWSREGVILFAGTDGLYRVAAQGGAPVLITKISPREEAHRWPYFLPDGRHFIFLADADTTEDHKVRIGSLDSPETPILFGAISRIVYAPPGYLLYVNQGALVAVPFDARSLKITGEAATVAERVMAVGDNHEYDFSVSDDGILAYQAGDSRTQLAWFDRTGKKLGTVGQPINCEDVMLSPDGHAAALGLLDADGREADVWLLDLTRNTTSRFTFDPKGDGTPLWSPDGSRIVFSSNRTGTGQMDLFEKGSSGAGDDKLLLKSEASKYATSWSRDGQFILFENWLPGAKSGVWVLSMSGDRQSKPLLQSSSFGQGQAQFSPDGRFVAYTSDESGRPEIYVQRFPSSSDKWQISTEGGSEALWSTDGKELFFITEEQKVMMAEIKVGSSLESSIPQMLFQTPLKLGLGYDYGVAPDGKRFLIRTPVEAGEGAPMTIVLNWANGLVKK